VGWAILTCVGASTVAWYITTYQDVAAAPDRHSRRCRAWSRAGEAIRTSAHQAQPFCHPQAEASRQGRVETGRTADATQRSRLEISATTIAQRRLTSEVISSHPSLPTTPQDVGAGLNPNDFRHTREGRRGAPVQARRLPSHNSAEPSIKTPAPRHSPEVGAAVLRPSSYACLHPCYGRRLPCAVQDRGATFLRPIHAHHRDEIALWCRQPVRFEICAG
jgi:hypothetical protein